MTNVVTSRLRRFKVHRPSRMALFATALLAAAVFPSAGSAATAAVGEFGPPQVLIPNSTFAVGDAAIAVDGTTRGFANRTGYSSGRVWFVRSMPGVTPYRQPTPYTGVVRSVAWDGSDATYVVFQYGNQLKIGKRLERSGAYSPATTLSTAGRPYNIFDADVVASGGRWWTVWNEVVGAGATWQTELFQQRTLLGVQGRTRITNTAAGIEDGQPTLAYANRRVTMVWSRAFSADPYLADLRIAESSGGSWLSRAFATIGSANYSPDLTIYAGVTWVAWGRDGRIALANNIGGFHSQGFLSTGNFPKVAVSGTKVILTWYGDYPEERVFLAEGSSVSGEWTFSDWAGPQSLPLRVLAQGGKARVVYSVQYPDQTGELLIRTQL